MTTKQVLELTATFLGKEDILNCSYFTGSNDALTNDEQKELDFLLRCLNLIVSEISTEYLPIYKQKDITFVNNCCSLNSVSQNIFRIHSLKDNFGNNIRFKIIDNNIYANVSSAIITYSKFADVCTLNGNVGDIENVVTERVLAYGTAMEYSQISSLFDDAAIWESRYKNALFSLTRKRHNIVMPKRRWL